MKLKWVIEPAMRFIREHIPAALLSQISNKLRQKDKWWKFKIYIKAEDVIDDQKQQGMNSQHHEI
jgi:hypothetical protein